MNIVLGIPVVGGKEVLAITLAHLISNTADLTRVKFVIIDNNSNEPFRMEQKPKGVDIIVMRNNKNVGYFYALQQLYDKYKEAHLIGLMHFDLAVYQKGWDNKIRLHFKMDKKLGLVSAFGWQGVTEMGQDILPVGNSDAESQKIYPSKHVKDIASAATVDSILMVFRRQAIPALRMYKNMLPKHFYDKIWPFRLREAGWRVGVVGVSFQHFSNNRVKDIEQAEAFRKWFCERWDTNAPIELVDDLAYFEGRVRFVHEFGELKGLLPCKINKNYQIIKTK